MTASSCSPSRPALKPRRQPDESGASVIRLREGAKSDLRALFELDQVCFQSGIAYSIDEMRYFLSTPRSLKVVAEDEDGRLAGFAIAELVRERGVSGGHVITIDVAPQMRRQGVGRLMMAALEQQLRGVSAGWIRLEVAVNNPVAQEFYASLQFQATARMRGYYLGKLDAIVMEKVVSPK